MALCLACSHSEHRDQCMYVGFGGSGVYPTCGCRRTRTVAVTPEAARLIEKVRTQGAFVNPDAILAELAK